MAVVELLRIEGSRLSVRGLDCLDGTPLLDLKPYFASTDAKPAAVVGWHKPREGSARAPDHARSTRRQDQAPTG